MTSKAVSLSTQFVILLMFMVMFVTSQDECLSEFHLPRITGRHKVSVRLLYDSKWKCYLTDPLDDKTSAFVHSLSAALIETHNSSKWFQSIAIKSFGKFSQSVIKVDYDLLVSEKLTVKHQLEVARDLYAHIFALGHNVKLDRKALKLDMPPALLLENTEGKTVHAYVNELHESPCELLIKSDACENGATCEVKEGHPYCKCIEGYKGPGCQTWKKEQERRALTILIILLVMMAFCISIFIFVTCCKNPLHFRFNRPGLKFQEKQPLPCADFESNPVTNSGSKAVITNSEVKQLKSSVTPSCVTVPSPDVHSPDVHIPFGIPTYSNPVIKQKGTAFAKGGCVPLVHPSHGANLPPPILLPLSEVPSARVTTRPTQDYLRFSNKKFKLYKCDGKFAWKKN